MAFPRTTNNTVHNYIQTVTERAKTLTRITYPNPISGSLLS